jgi:hypothetical protein
MGNVKNSESDLVGYIKAGTELERMVNVSTKNNETCH